MKITVDVDTTAAKAAASRVSKGLRPAIAWLVSALIVAGCVFAWAWLRGYT